MRIGIDIDGVLTDIERFMLDYGSKYCMERNLPLKLDPSEYDDIKMFNCTEEDAVNFWRTYVIDYFKKYPARDFAVEVLNKLKQEGHEIIIITARNEYGVPTEYISKVKEITEKWLKDNSIPYDKIIYTEGSKLPFCIGNYVEVMVEDSPKNIKDISINIPTICFSCEYNSKVEGKNITRAYTWYDVYDKIRKMGA